jgi:putative transposase
MRLAQVHHPFRMRAYAFMPEHLHLLMYVPETTNISKLMQSIEQNMTINHKQVHGVTRSLHLWQRGFWDHVIRDEDDFERHFDYIHYNPVKHGLVTHPRDYAHTSYGVYAGRGWYEPEWGQDGTPATLRQPGFEPGE